MAGQGRRLLGSVRCLPWDDRTNTTAQLIDITRPTRDQMHMAVHDGLPSRLAAVHAHVEAFDRLVLRKHLPPHLIEQQVDRAPLWVVEIEEARRVPARNDERVQRVTG